MKSAFVISIARKQFKIESIFRQALSIISQNLMETSTFLISHAIWGLLLDVMNSTHSRICTKLDERNLYCTLGSKSFRNSDKSIIHALFAISSITSIGFEFKIYRHTHYTTHHIMKNRK